MEALVILAVIFAIAYIVGSSRNVAAENKKREETVHEALRRSIIQSAVEEWYDRLDAEINTHIDTLRKKYQMLVFTDDYGRENKSRFLSEAAYFCDTIVSADLVEEIGRDQVIELITDAAQYAVLAHPVNGAAYARDMRGEEFEALVEGIFHRYGIEVRRTPITGDQGVDLIAEIYGDRVAIQCKRSATAVGNKAVQEVVAGRTHYDAQMAWVIADAQFTPGARQLAKSNNVLLLHYSDLDQILAGA
ncbi:restriction endonuclease [Sphingobium yanoikuyae]|uniref:restriction endonuclease n=1 Tax=Sphingobium yanoikuyae TaxID=13690 RepID=UPI0028ACD946|nr:restriction endonuclease [Sphingobium yanoikuyae]